MANGLLALELIIGGRMDNSEISSIGNNAEEDLLNAIQRSTDTDLRSVLMFQLRTLRALDSTIMALGNKIDAFISDEKRIAAIALEKHYKNHDRDHSWIDFKIKEEPIVAEERRWIRRLIDEESRKCRQQRDDEIDARKQARAVVFRMIERIVTWATIAILALIGFTK